MKTRWRGLILIAAVCLASCGPAGPQAVSIDPPKLENAPLPTGPKAPALHNQTWLNVERPLTPADLDGKVVLIDFWTFG